MKFIEVSTRSQMATALWMANFECCHEMTITLKDSNFRIVLKSPLESGEWQETVLNARNRGIKRLSNRIKRSSKKLWRG